MQKGSRKGLRRVQEGGFLCRKGEGGFLSDMHMPHPTHGAQLKPSNGPPLALPMPLTLGKQY